MKFSGVLMVHIMFGWGCILANGEEVTSEKVREEAGGENIKLESRPEISGTGALNDENVKHESSLIDTEPIFPTPQPLPSPNTAESQLVLEPIPIIEEPVVKTEILQTEPTLFYGPYVKYGFPIPYGHHGYRYFGKKFGFRLGPLGIGFGLGLGLGRHHGYPGLFFHKGFHKSFHFFG